MRGILVWFVVWIAFMVQAIVVHFLPIPPWGKLLVAALYGGVIGWGIVRWKDSRARGAGDRAPP